jgi:hypothetical protein
MSYHYLDKKREPQLLWLQEDKGYEEKLQRAATLSVLYDTR